MSTGLSANGRGRWLAVVVSLAASAGMGYAAVPIAGALIATAGLALVLVQRATNVRRRKVAMQGC